MDIFKAKRAELMKKLQEKEKNADLNREEAIRERAERAKKDREEREMKVRAKKEEEKEKEKKKMEAIKDRERQAMELKKRQAQSPVRGEKERNGPRVSTVEERRKFSMVVDNVNADSDSNEREESSS